MTKYLARMVINGQPTVNLEGTTERKTKRALFDIMVANSSAILEALPTIEEWKWNTARKAYEFKDVNKEELGYIYLDCEPVA